MELKELGMHTAAVDCVTISFIVSEGAEHSRLERMINDLGAQRTFPEEDDDSELSKVYHFKVGASQADEVLSQIKSNYASLIDYAELPPWRKLR